MIPDKGPLKKKKKKKLMLRTKNQRDHTLILQTMEIKQERHIQMPNLCLTRVTSRFH